MSEEERSDDESNDEESRPLNAPHAMQKKTIIIVSIIVLVVFWLWAELAVGLFTDWGN